MRIQSGLPTKMQHCLVYARNRVARKSVPGGSLVLLLVPSGAASAGTRVRPGSEVESKLNYAGAGSMAGGRPFLLVPVSCHQTQTPAQARQATPRRPSPETLDVPFAKPNKRYGRVSLHPQSIPLQFVQIATDD